MPEQTLEMLTWLVPVPPVLAFFIITVFDNWPALRERRWRTINALIAIGAIVISWVFSWIVVIEGLNRGGEALAHHPIATGINWYPTSLAGGFGMGVMVDPLTVVGLFFVPLTAGCIFIYSHGYMAHDEKYSRFFSYIALFAGAMLTLVVADNLLLLFVGWEVMGLCSYLLIGFWAHKDYPEESGKTMNPRKAAVRAFITTRVGDMLMLLGIGLLYAAAGTLDFQGILYSETMLDKLAATDSVIVPGWSVAALAGVLLVGGAVGKSAQFPLHVWLPDAMEGPTPVSAMIHAATMVSAGVFMVIRMFPLMSAGFDPHRGEFAPPMIVLGLIGAFTAFMAATIAVTQNDVKAVLAYSTISQLGYMLAALGIGAYVAATFHLVTHAIFKALLFMGSGSIIHGMEHGEHHAHECEHGHKPLTDGVNPKYFDPQDMRNMGGLRKKMPHTYRTFVVGGLALSGFPIITSGFWSKDEILADALYHSAEGRFLGLFVFILLATAAFLTAFYTMRQIAMVFLGEPRTEAATHATESHWTMWAPLYLLAAFTLVIGFVGVHPDFPIIGLLYEHNPLHDFMGPIVLHEPALLEFMWGALFTSLVAALGGLTLGYLIYAVQFFDFKMRGGYKTPHDRDWVQGVVGDWLYGVVARKYYVDEFYNWAFVGPAKWLSERFSYQIIDKGIIDRIIEAVPPVMSAIGNFFRAFNTGVVDGVGDGIPIGIGQFARWFRPIQSGKIQQYLLVAALSALLIGLIFVLAVR
ncbi:MAG: NADH-quinone oxidoreductase subunit L [Anaerolineae bacterium]|nr:NADH-quinone oxidoreductase subunit L [Anaerolineae bacterium]